MILSTEKLNNGYLSICQESDCHIKRSETLVISAVLRKRILILTLGAHDETPLLLALKVSFRVHLKKQQKMVLFPFSASISAGL